MQSGHRRQQVRPAVAGSPTCKPNARPMPQTHCCQARVPKADAETYARTGGSGSKCLASQIFKFGFQIKRNKFCGRMVTPVVTHWQLGGASMPGTVWFRP